MYCWPLQEGFSYTLSLTTKLLQHYVTYWTCTVPPAKFSVGSLLPFTFAEDQDDYGMDDYDDIFNSPSVEESFQQATLIATLAEKFGMTSFKPFQKNVISATLDGRDTLVIHPTGSGKSLCFQFPPVYQNKKAIVVTPTISLMQDQVHALNSKGIPCVLVGSAQVDKQVEMHALEPDSKELLIFVVLGVNLP